MIAATSGRQRATNPGGLTESAFPRLLTGLLIELAKMFDA